MIPAFITVRTASTRLPEKCLLDFGGITVFQHVIRRCKAGGLKPYICTTEHESDDRLEALAYEEGLTEKEIYRGQADNPMARWMAASEWFDVDMWHTIDCDDPFFNWDEVKRSFEFLKRNQIAFLHPTELSAAEGLGLMGTSINPAEDFTKVMALPPPRSQPANIRMTLDYPEDYWFLRTLVRLGINYASPRKLIDFAIDDYSLTKINSFRTADWKANRESSPAI